MKISYVTKCLNNQLFLSYSDLLFNYLCDVTEQLIIRTPPLKSKIIKAEEILIRKNQNNKNLENFLTEKVK